jgi:hypothetical protein
MKHFITLFFGLAALTAFPQNYASYNNVPVARASFLRSQWTNGNVYKDSSLIFYWPMTRASGTYYDYSGHGIIGLFQGMVSGGPYSGKIGPYAPYLTKNGPNSISLPTTPTLTVPFTVSVWVKANAPSGGYSRILETDYEKGVYLGLDSTMSKFQFIVNVGTGSVGTCSGGTITAGLWPNSPWQMVTGVYDGTYGSLYVNGVQAAASCPFSSPGTTSLPMKVGYCYVANYCAGSTGAWDGQIASVRVYGRALSAAEITAIYNAEKN